MDNRIKNKVLESAEEKRCACWLDTIYWFPGNAKYKLYHAAGSTREIYDMTEAQVTALVGAKLGRLFAQQKKRYSPQQIWDYISRLGIKYTYCQEEEFPEKLAMISDAPFGIFYKGMLPERTVPAVAIIGARKCSAYGQMMAAHFASVLAKYKVNIVSGMALGIDGAGQQAALHAGGKSFGVLGCGVDVIYPKANEMLYRELQESGGLLSEYPPGMEPRPALFPMRNRIISALSDAVIVVEAREKSGTLITVDMALEQGREVYAVPGRCTDSLSKGCLWLLRQGAGVAADPEEFIRDMHWEQVLCAPPEKISSEKQNPSQCCLSQTAKEVYQILDILPDTQDNIVRKLRERKKNYSIPQICNGLVELELKGLAVRRGGQYSLTKAVFDRA